MKPSIHAVFKVLCELLRASLLAGSFQALLRTNQAVLTSVERPGNARVRWMTDADQTLRRAQPQP